MAEKVLADVNVCLDLLLDRKPFVDASGKLFELAENGKIELFVSGLSFDTLFYIMRPEMGADSAINILREFSKHVNVGAVNSIVVNKALDAGWKDLEDALQFFCALENNCSTILTRNKQDFKKGLDSLIILTPEEYLKMRE